MEPVRRGGGGKRGVVVCTGLHYESMGPCSRDDDDIDGRDGTKGEMDGGWGCCWLERA